MVVIGVLAVISANYFIKTLKTQMVIHLSVEKEQLHKQVSYYSERFEDFNETLAKSNEAISGFR